MSSLKPTLSVSVSPLDRPSTLSSLLPAEAEAEHAEAALKSAVPAMQEWWIQVLSRGRFPDVSGITTGFEAVSPGKSPTLRGSRGRDTARAPKREKAPSGPVTGTRARLAGAAALLASPERDD